MNDFNLVRTKKQYQKARYFLFNMDSDKDSRTATKENILRKVYKKR